MAALRLTGPARTFERTPADIRSRPASAEALAGRVHLPNPLRAPLHSDLFQKLPGEPHISSDPQVPPAPMGFTRFLVGLDFKFDVS